MEKITVEATLENLQTVIDFATERLEVRDCPMKISMQIELVVEEIFVNIASYAYNPETGTATFCMEFEDNPDALKMTFIDGGKPYNPLEKRPRYDACTRRTRCRRLGDFSCQKKRRRNCLRICKRKKYSPHEKISLRLSR